MSRERIRKALLCLGGLIVAVGALTALAGVAGTNRAPQPLQSQIVRQDEARVTKGDWGKMYRYFEGESFATRNALVAMAVVEPGKAVHRAHRHSQEEYLVLVEGSGVWSLDGREIPARKGDVLYTAPWAYHGLTNTGSTPLTFLVVRYDGKGVEMPPRPDDRPDEP
jgi:mannose-6-phosphate isomerase-like protein (cupin superfamily)